MLRWFGPIEQIDERRVMRQIIRSEWPSQPLPISGDSETFLIYLHLKLKQQLI